MPIKRYHHHYMTLEGNVFRVTSPYAHRPRTEDEPRMARAHNHYGPWLVYEYIGETHYAFPTTHETNKHQFCMASLPEAGTKQLDKHIYLGMVRDV